MAEMTIAGSIQNTRNNVTDADGYALPPLAANLKEGQIAVNTCETDPCIFFKTSEGKIVKIVSEEKLTKALTDILGNSAADLATLRELIALFEGSANDILPMLTDLTDRVTAAETSLTSKADKSALNTHTGNTSNPHSVTKAQVGLSNVDNTADSAKPVSTAQATAIADAKKAGTDAQTSLTSHVSNKANPHAVTAAQVGALAVGAAAEDSKKLGGIVAANFWHAGNSNKADVDWTARIVKADSVLIKRTSDNTYQAGLSLDNSNNALEVFNSSGGAPIIFKTNGGEVVRFLNNGLVGIGTPTPTERLDVDGNVNINGYTISNASNFVTVGFIDGLKYYSLRKCGVLPDAKQLVILIGEIGTNSKRNKTYVNGRFIVERGTESSWNQSAVWDVMITDAYHTTTGDLKTFGTGLDSEMGVCTYNGKRYIALRATSTISASDIIFSGMASGNCVLSAITMDSCSNWVKVDSGASIIKGLLECESSVNVSGNVTAKGDVVAKSTNAVVFSTSDAAAGATRLNDLIDVKLPTNLADKMVLAYDPAQVNSDGSKGGYTFMPSAGTGTGTVSSAEIASLPEHNHNDLVYTSDERLKNNITDLKDRAIKMILSLAPKSFGWNDKAKSFGLNDSISYGLIAQEVEKVMPELVKPLGKEDYIGVDYIKIIPILLAGIQEQHKEIISLNQKLEAMKNRANKAYGNETNNADEIANLKAEIAELKMLINK